jgi:hypothetical protein
MSEVLAVVGAAIGGMLVGGAAGWPVGRRTRGRPAAWLAAMVIALLGGCYAAFQAMYDGRQLLADAWLGFAFGSMTAIKYAGGILPGTEVKESEPAAD